MFIGMARKFEGQVAWVTGGGTGIGRAVALELGLQGARVAVSGRREDRLDEVVAELRAAGADGFAIVCDVTDPESTRQAVATVVEKWGKLDVAVANAGFGVSARFEDITPDRFRRQLDVNVLGTVFTAQSALPELRKTKGRLVLVGSVAAIAVYPGGSAYCASKAAVRAMGQTLSIELAGSGVSCTTIHPGFVESEINQVDNDGNLQPGRPDKRPKAFMWPADRAARAMVRAIQRRRREYVFTGLGKVGAFVGRHFPWVIYLAMRTPRARREAEAAIIE